MKQFFEKIVNNKSLTIIHYLCEDELEKQIDDVEDRQAIVNINDCNNLDLCWAYAFDRLGEHDIAQQLREFQTNKKGN